MKAIVIREPKRKLYGIAPSRAVPLAAQLVLYSAYRIRNELCYHVHRRRRVCAGYHGHDGHHHGHHDGHHHGRRDASPSVTLDSALEQIVAPAVARLDTELACSGE